MSREESHTKVIVLGKLYRISKPKTIHQEWRLQRADKARHMQQHSTQTINPTTAQQHMYAHTDESPRVSHSQCFSTALHANQRSFLPSDRLVSVRRSFKRCILPQTNLFLNPAERFCCLTKIKQQVKKNKSIKAKKLSDRKPEGKLLPLRHIAIQSLSLVHIDCSVLHINPRHISACSDLILMSFVSICNMQCPLLFNSIILI